LLPDRQIFASSLISPSSLILFASSSQKIKVSISLYLLCSCKETEKILA
jgi:hypothetical protein